MAGRFLSREPFPYLRVRISLKGWETEAVALMDTGFTGDVMIPDGILPADIGSPDSVREYRVADGRFVTSEMFYGDLEIPGLPPIAHVAIGVMGSKYLIGEGIIRRYTVILDRGERVIIEE